MSASQGHSPMASQTSLGSIYWLTMSSMISSVYSCSEILVGGGCYIDLILLTVIITSHSRSSGLGKKEQICFNASATWSKAILSKTIYWPSLSLVPPPRWWGPSDKHRVVPLQFCKENTRGHSMALADKIKSFTVKRSRMIPAQSLSIARTHIITSLIEIE